VASGGVADDRNYLSYWGFSKYMRTLLAASILLFAVTGTASAAEVSLQDVAGGGKSLVYTAKPGEINDVAINLQGGEYTIQDTAGSPLTPRSPCTTWEDPMLLGTSAKCPANAVNAIQVALGDQTDEVSVGGISNVLVPVTIDSGSEPDQIFSGGGPDTINVFNGVAGDNVTCNAGEDTVYADPGDTVAADCEHVLLQPPPDKHAAFRARVRVGPSTVRYGCSARCTVKGTLLLRGRKAGSVGRAALPNGGTARLRFKLTRAGKHALASRGRLRLRLTTTFTTDSGITELDNPVVLVR
jgi:hypothetical protein